MVYEFRRCIKLGTAATAAEGIGRAFQRVCIDLRNLSERGLHGLRDVPSPCRLRVWADDIEAARPALGL